MEKKIDGLLVCEVLYEELKKYIDKKGGRPPHLVDVSLGDDTAGKMYANMKKKKLESLVGFNVDSIHYDNISVEELVKNIAEWNSDENIDGLMFQLPFPKEYREQQQMLLNQIVAGKDIDGLTEISLGKLYSGSYAMQPCTPKGIITLLRAYDVELAHKNVCIINRTNVVGKPLVQMFLDCDATVTICHSKTKNLADITSKADIVVAALNRQELIDKNYIKEGAIVIDVGVHKNSEGKTVGDVLFDDVYNKCSLITPPTGAVGPMTICMLAYNTALSRYGDEVQEVFNTALLKAKDKIKK